MAATRAGGQSYIIKRPRLTKLLDESEARIILLCAPAGYGKTTLAREWAESIALPKTAWYLGGVEMADPAALAVELAAAVESIGVDSTLRTRIGQAVVSSTPPEILGRELALAAADARALILIEDYHHALSSSESERLLEAFVRHSPARFLVTSRIQPSWISARDEVYGDVVALRSDVLVFDESEAASVLGPSVADDTRNELLGVAGGWPAVIGMAAIRGAAAVAAPLDVLPNELFQFLAKDLFAAVPERLRRPLFLMASFGGRNTQLLESLLGQQFAESMDVGLRHGFVTRPAVDAYSMHPLIRAFLLEEMRRAGDAPGLVRLALRNLSSVGDWDECLRLLEDFEMPAELNQVFLEAIDALLAEGRIATVERWIDLGGSSGVDTSLLLVAKAEVGLRRGSNAEAQALAGQAAAELGRGDLAVRAGLIAARAAHLRGDGEASRSASERVWDMSNGDLQTRAQTVWFEFLHAVEDGKRAAAAQHLDRFAALDISTAAHALRVANARAIHANEVMGRPLDAERHLESSHALLEHVADPLARTNFRAFRVSLALFLADFDRALTLCDELETDARTSGLEFVLSHARLLRATGLIGLRKLRAAGWLLDALAREENLISFVEGQVAIKRVRLDVASGNLKRALLRLRGGPPAMVAPASIGEWYGMTALLNAATEDLALASEAAVRARDASCCIDATDLSYLADGICELVGSPKTYPATLIQTVVRLLESGHREIIVLAARAYPPLVKAVVEGLPETRDAITVLLGASNDVPIGRAAGLDMPRELRRTEGLSPKEREVYELLVQGLTNREIAAVLFISESTAKVHVRHIFDKLGVRTRAQAAAISQAGD